MTHIFELETEVFEQVKDSLRNFLILDTNRPIYAEDRLFLQCDGYEIETYVSSVNNSVEQMLLKKGAIAITFLKATSGLLISK